MEYHKIHSLYKRDPSGKRMLFGEYSCPEFEYLKDNEWSFTEKIDGSNIRAIIENGGVRFGGKTDNAQIPTKLLGFLQDKFLTPEGLTAVLAKFPSGGILYGEGYGAGIQTGSNYRKDQSFVLFDVNVGGWWLNRDDVEDVAQTLRLDVVPIIATGSLFAFEEVVRGSFLSRWGDFTAEGLVARPAVELKTRGGERIITKLKHKDFLYGNR